MRLSQVAGCLFLAVSASFAQNQPPGSSGLIRNGSFETTLQTPNLWTGVDRDGFLAGFRGDLPVLGEGGRIADTPMPVSVAVGDMNKDGLPDILTADTTGYVRLYLNSGSKAQAKFTSGLATTPYLNLPGLDPDPTPSIPGIKRDMLWFRRRMGVRLSLADLGGGRRGLVAGNYFGEIFMLPQSGTAATSFSQPKAVEDVMLKMSKEPSRRWGNVFAPLISDWDGDGRGDLLVGEGSYSANNVHFFPNEGSAGSPVYNLANRSALALGEGHEQLTPAIADVNGDGKNDLLVADRRGRVTAYLRPAGWKKGDSISPSGQLAKAGGLTKDDNQSLVLGSGVHTIATGDLNGDGLFDLVVGKPSGRIAWSPNKGTKEQPKFDPPMDLPGDKPVPAVWLVPSQWELDVGEARGNTFAYASCVSAQEDPAVGAKAGSRALKFGFAAAAGSPLANLSIPGNGKFRFGDYQQSHTFYYLSPYQRLLGAPNRIFMMQQSLQMEVGKPYTLSFQYKGAGVVRANVFVGWWGFKVLGAETISRGARGASKVQYNHANEHGKIFKDFKPSSSWSTLQEKFMVKFSNKDLKDVKTTQSAVINIIFELSAPDGTLYLDDLKIVSEG